MKMFNSNKKPYVLNRWVFLFSIFVSLVLFTSLTRTKGATQKVSAATTMTPAWLEPQGLSIIQAVGQLPESILKDVMVRFPVNNAIMQYVSGERNGDYVTVLVTNESITPNKVFCISSPGTHDELPIVVPESKVRVFSNGVDVTNRVIVSYKLYPAGKIQPAQGSVGGARYDSVTATASFDSSGRLLLPANMGCEFNLSGTTLSNVTVEFEFYSPQTISMTLILHDQKGRPSYIHPTNTIGALGNYADLNAQLHDYNDKYNREDGTVARLAEIAKLDPWGRNHSMTIPDSVSSDADFILMKYPPAPFHGFAPQAANITNPVRGAGTIRINSGSPDFVPSVDHVNGMFVPLHGNWVDRDRSAGEEFLPRFDYPRWVTVPEIVAPPGMAYHSCMTNGQPDCPNSVLNSIYQYSVPIDLYYIKVERIKGGLEQIPLKAVGPNWSPSRSDVVSTEQKSDDTLSTPERSTFTFSVYLPIAQTPEIIPDDMPSANCPCGWFDSNGIMYDFVSPP